MQTSASTDPASTNNATPEAMSRTEWRATGTLASVYAMRMLGLFMVLPVFALLGEDIPGATPFMIGLAIGAYGFSQAIFQIPFGALSDRIGRKPVILGGLIVFCLGSLIAAYAESIQMIIVGRILQGAGAIASVLMALLADLTREEYRTRAMAVIGMSIGLAFSVALVVGPLVAGAWGLKGLFLITAAMAILALAVVIWSVPDPVRLARPQGSGSWRKQFAEVIVMPDLLRLDCGIFLLHMILTALFVAVPLVLRDSVGMPQETHWQLYLVVLLTSFFGMIPMIAVAEKKRLLKPFFLAAIVMLGGSLFLLPDLTGTPWQIGMVLVVFFTAFNFLEASLPSMISRLAPPANKGTAMGVYSSSQFFGAFAGGLLGGAVMQVWGGQALFWVLGGVTLVWLGIAAGLREPGHFASFMVRLRNTSEADIHQVTTGLGLIPGVEDVLVIAEDGIAYIKADRRKLDEGALQAFRQKVEAPCSA